MPGGHKQPAPPRNSKALSDIRGHFPSKSDREQHSGAMATAHGLDAGGGSSSGGGGGSLRRSHLVGRAKEAQQMPQLPEAL